MPAHHIRETIRLSTLALSRLSSKFDREKVNSENYIEQLRKFDNFQTMLSYIASGLKVVKGKPGEVSDSKSDNKSIVVEVKQQHFDLDQIFKETLKYLLNVLENVTSDEKLR